MKRLTLILLVAFFLRIGGAMWWQGAISGQFGFGDSESYWELGRAMAHGGPYQFGSAEAKVFRTPGYPALLAPLFWTFGKNPPVMAARVLGAVAGTLAVGLIWWLTRELFDTRSADLAALVAAVYPGAIASSVLVLTEGVFGTAMLLQMVFQQLAWRQTRWPPAIGWAVGAGLAAGIATLIRPSWLLFMPWMLLAGLILGVRSRLPDRRHPTPTQVPFSHAGRLRFLGLGLCTLAGLIVAMLPWWIRNARAVGRFVPTTLQVGASLYDGLNPLATGGSQMDFVPRFERAERAVPRRSTDVPFEIRLDASMRQAACQWARERPDRATQLGGIKLIRMWNIWPNEPRLSSWPVRLGVLATYLPVVLLAMIGGVRTFRRAWPYAYCWLPAVYFSMLHVVFVSSIRYRQPAMLLLIVLAAGVRCGWRDQE